MSPRGTGHHLPTERQKMATLEIPITTNLIVSMIRALDDATDRDDLYEFLYDHGRYLCDIAGDVGAIRALENAAMDRDLTDAEFAALNKCRQSNNPWIHRKAGIILQDIADTANDRAVCDASSVDERPGQDAGSELVGIYCYFSNNGRDWTPFAAKVTFFDSHRGYSSLNTVKAPAWPYTNHGDLTWWKFAKPSDTEATP